LLATSSIIFEDQLPLISLGGFSLHISDLILLGSLGFIGLRSLIQRRYVRTPLDWPLIVFFSITLLSTFLAVANGSLDGVEARRWIRIITYYLTFFVVTNMVGNRRQLDFLVNGIFLLATIVAAVMIMQFALGSSVQILPGRVESLWTQGTTFEDITRVLPPGISIVIVSFITLICILTLTKSESKRLPGFIQCGLLGSALLLTFLRSYWAAIIAVFALMLILIRKRDRLRIAKWCLVILYLATIILLVVFINPDSRMAKLVDASANRLNTLTNAGTFEGQDSSLNWRLIENKYAYSSIMSHPWLGIGMGPDIDLSIHGSIHGSLITILESIFTTDIYGSCWIQV
jgi:hypothetical protein